MSAVSAAPADGAQQVAGSVAGLLGDCSLEVTAKDSDALAAGTLPVPSGTRVHITYLGPETAEARIATARLIRENHLKPVPHLSARRLASGAQFADLLAGLNAEHATQQVFVVGGDPQLPAGPYADALSLIRSDLLERHGVQSVAVAGYPEGHPAIDDAVLWAALTAKLAELHRRDLSSAIVTQFGFDANAVLRWVERVRAAGIEVPIRIGVPGPTSVRRLLAYARRFGLGTSASIAKKYGLSVVNLMNTAGPDRFIESLAAEYEPAAHGELRFHFYTFGGLTETATWLAGYHGAALSR